jgi:hypothetical protein
MTMPYNRFPVSPRGPVQAAALYDGAAVWVPRGRADYARDFAMRIVSWNCRNGLTEKKKD